MNFSVLWKQILLLKRVFTNYFLFSAAFSIGVGLDVWLKQLWLHECLSWVLLVCHILSHVYLALMYNIAWMLDVTVWLCVPHNSAALCEYRENLWQLLFLLCKETVYFNDTLVKVSKSFIILVTNCLFSVTYTFFFVWKLAVALLGTACWRTQWSVTLCGSNYIMSAGLCTVMLRTLHVHYA